MNPHKVNGGQLYTETCSWTEETTAGVAETCVFIVLEHVHAALLHQNKQDQTIEPFDLYKTLFLHLFLCCSIAHRMRSGPWFARQRSTSGCTFQAIYPRRHSFTYFRWRPCIFIIAELIRKILPYNSRVRLIQEKVPMEVNGCHLSAKYWKLSLNRLDTGQSNRKSETCLYCSETSHHATLYIINPCRCRATNNPFFYLYKTRFFISSLVLFSCLRMRSEPGCVI